MRFSSRRPRSAACEATSTARRRGVAATVGAKTLGALVALIALAASPAAAAAQGGVRLVIPVSPALLVPGEEERLTCTRQRATEQLTAAYPGQPLFPIATEGTLPQRWRVLLQESQRTVTVILSRAYVPREVLVEFGATAGIPWSHESVRVRYLPTGEMQEGTHAITPARGAPPSLAPIDTVEARWLYDLARELAFRCDRRLTDAVPVGSTAGQIPPQ